MLYGGFIGAFQQQELGSKLSSGITAALTALLRDRNYPVIEELWRTMPTNLSFFFFLTDSVIFAISPLPC